MSNQLSSFCNIIIISIFKKDRPVSIIVNNLQQDSVLFCYENLKAFLN